MGSKSGGGAGDMLAYGDKALDLQKTIYDQSRADAQPWLQAGTAGVGELAKRLGLNTAASPANRESLVKQYTPQFTTTIPGAAGAGTEAGYNDLKSQLGGISAENSAKLSDYLAKGLNGAPTTQVDNAGLNSYVDNMLAQQGQAAQSDPNYGSLLQTFDTSKYQEDPGYQFRLQEGQKALERALNSRGKNYSPEAIKALTEYNSGMASQEYGSAYDRYNNDQNNIYNRLAGISGVGQQTSAQLANSGQNYANSASDIFTGQGNAITAANQAKAAGNQSMFNTLLGGGLGFAKLFGG